MRQTYLISGCSSQHQVDDTRKGAHKAPSPLIHVGAGLLPGQVMRVPPLCNYATIIGLLEEARREEGAADQLHGHVAAHLACLRVRLSVVNSDARLVVADHAREGNLGVAPPVVDG